MDGYEGQPLATVDELQARLGFEMGDDDRREAAGALASLSDDARSYGRAMWLDRESAPSAVRNLVLKAANRFMKNYEGYVQSRAGDETLGWSDIGADAGSPFFTDREIESLRRMAGASNIHSTPIVAWGSRPMNAYESDEFVRSDHGPMLHYFAGPRRVGS